MSCPPNQDCSGTPVAGGGQLVVNVPQRNCSGATFCDDNLEGLPFANQVDLVGVPEGDRCLKRVNAPTGIWHHDPSRAGGADYVAPLVLTGANLSETECGFQPALRLKTDGTVELVKQDVIDRSDGDLAVVTKCAGGTQRTDILDPEEFDEDNPCEANLSLLGWVSRIVISNGQNTVQKIWKQITRLLFPATQVSSFTDSDYTDGTIWRRAAFKKNGSCWELGLDEPDPAVSDSCADLTSTGTTFPFLLACKDGVTQKVEPTAGMSPVGDGTNWNLRPAGGTLINPRILVGQKREGFTVNRTSSGMSAIIDDPVPTSGQTTGTYTMTAIPGYIAGASVAKVRCVCEVNNLSADGFPVASVKLNDQVAIEASMASFGYAFQNTTYLDVKLTNDTFTFDLRSAVTNPSTAQSFAKLEIVGWE